LQNTTTTSETETSPVVQLAQNITTTTTDTSSMGEQLQNTTPASETISIPGTSSHHQAVRQPFKRKTILSWLLDCKLFV